MHLQLIRFLCAQGKDSRAGSIQPGSHCRGPTGIGAGARTYHCNHHCSLVIVAGPSLCSTCGRSCPTSPADPAVSVVLCQPMVQPQISLTGSGQPPYASAAWWALHQPLQEVYCSASQCATFRVCMPGVYVSCSSTTAVAANLLKAGLPVLVFDRNPAAVDKMVQLGAKAAASPLEIGETPGATFWAKLGWSKRTCQVTLGSPAQHCSAYCVKAGGCCKGSCCLTAAVSALLEALGLSQRRIIETTPEQQSIEQQGAAIPVLVSMCGTSSSLNYTSC